MKRTCLLLLATLLLTACSPDQATTSLEAAVDAAIAADAVARPQDAPYLTLATSCLDQAETILAGTETPAVKGAQIGAACASAVAASAGAPPSVQAVAVALNTFLSHVHQTAAALQVSGPVNSFAPPSPSAPKPSKEKLKKIRKKLDILKARRR